MIILCLALFLSCGKNLDDDLDGFDELTNDCDDSNPNIHPDAVEICDGIDNNCNGQIDELGAVGGRVWYADLDRDGYGDDGLTIEACTQPEGYAENKWDCNESNASINPGMDEICDGFDNDCDGEIDEATAVDAPSWYPDYDGDGFGNDALTKNSCIQPLDHLPTGGDCNDDDPLIHPNQIENCTTAIDDNCNGEINEDNAIGCNDWFADVDGDGFPGTLRCMCSPEDPFVYSEGNDCNDEDDTINPEAAVEDVGWTDNDCSGSSVRWLHDAEYSYEYAEEVPNAQWVQYMNHVQSGDIDNDEIGDIVISYYHSSTDPGAVLMQSGAEYDQVHAIWENPTAKIQGTLSSLFSESAVSRSIGQHPAVLEDFNRDGIDDVVVAHTTDNQRIEMFFFWGPMAGEYTLDQADETLERAFLYDNRINMFSMQEGENVALLLADPYGHNYEELSAGRYDVIAWNSNLNELEVVRSVEGFDSGQKMGLAGGNAGDVNGDGFEDEVLLTDTTSTMDPFGQLTSTKYGSMDLYYGGQLFPDVTVVSNLFYWRIADQFAGAGDYNGDGYADIAFSAKDSNVFQYDSGRTQILWGPLSGGTYDMVDLNPFILTGFVEGMQANCPQSVGDIDGDGKDDLLIGAQMENWYEEANDGALLWFGHHAEGTHQLDKGTTAILSNRNKSRRSGWCNFGMRVKTGLGDINQDGFDDFVIGGSSANTNEDNRDGLWLFMGSER